WSSSGTWPRWVATLRALPPISACTLTTAGPTRSTRRVKSGSPATSSGAGVAGCVASGVCALAAFCPLHAPTPATANASDRNRGRRECLAAVIVDESSFAMERENRPPARRRDGSGLRGCRRRIGFAGIGGIRAFARGRARGFAFRDQRLQRRRQPAQRGGGERVVGRHAAAVLLAEADGQAGIGAIVRQHRPRP